MTALILNLDTASIHIAANNSVTGGLWWSIGDQPFPEKGWNDFPLIVLGWWTSSLFRLSQNASHEETLRFMDGPFSVKLQKAHNGLVATSFQRSGKRPVIVADGTEHSLVDIINEVCRASGLVLNWLQEKGIHNRDTTFLAEAVLAIED